MRGYIRSQVTDVGARKPLTPFTGMIGKKLSSFTGPASIPGLSLWVDSSNASSLITNGAGNFASVSSQYLSCASNSTLQAGDVDFWVACWVKVVDGTAVNYLVGKTFGGSFEYQLNTAGSLFEFYVNSGGTTARASNFGIPPNNTWIFVFAWYDKTTDLINISVNGGTANTRALAGGATAGSAPLLLGTNTGSSSFANCTLDSVAFGKSPPGGITAIASAIRDALYNSGSGVTSASITSAQKTAWGGISWWDMASSGSGLLVDSWGSNTLTNNNGVTCVAGIASGMATSDGDPISQWTDLSGNSNSLAQATFSKRPILKLAIQNGKNVVRFDGVDDFMLKTFTDNQPVTIFIAGNLRSVGVASANDVVYDGGAATVTLLVDSTPYTSISAGTALPTSPDPAGNFTAMNPAWGEVTAQFNTTSSVLRYNQVVKASGDAGANNAGGFALGGTRTGTRCTQLDAGEIIVATGVQTAAIISQTESYLISKWGIS